MNAVTQASIPPLPTNTAGKWLDVVCEDVDMVRRWLNVMYQMDRRYMREGIATFRNCLGHRPSSAGASYYYWTPNSELALRLIYVTTRKQHLIASVGFVGNVSPKDALDLLIEQVQVYLRERQATSAFAIVPKDIENPQALELYDLFRHDPRFHITVECEASAVGRWNIEAPHTP